jgi:hypothetical protein
MNCVKATTLMSQGMDRTLSFGEAVGTRVHTFTCVNCRHFKLQLNVLRQAAKQMAHGTLPNAADKSPQDSDKTL